MFKDTPFKKRDLKSHHKKTFSRNKEKDGREKMEMKGAKHSSSDVQHELN